MCPALIVLAVVCLFLDFFFTGVGEGNIVDSLIPLLWALGFVELPEIRKQAARHTQTRACTQRLTDRQRKRAHKQGRRGDFAQGVHEWNKGRIRAAGS